MGRSRSRPAFFRAFCRASSSFSFEGAAGEAAPGADAADWVGALLQAPASRAAARAPPRTGAERRVIANPPGERGEGRGIVAARERRGRPDPVARRRWEGREEGRGGARPPVRLSKGVERADAAPDPTTPGEREIAAHAPGGSETAPRVGDYNKLRAGGAAPREESYPRSLARFVVPGRAAGPWGLRSLPQTAARFSGG